MSRDLIYFSPIPWHGLYQRPQHCVRHLSRGRRVLFVEPLTLHVQAPPADEKRLAFLALPIIPSNARNPLIRHAARLGAALPPLRRFVELRQSLRLCRKLDALEKAGRFSIYSGDDDNAHSHGDGPGSGNGHKRGNGPDSGDDRGPILFFGHPEFFSLRRCYPRAPLVYDHMDDILGFGDPPPALRQNLAALVRDADLVNATSERLAEQMTQLGARRLLRIGNGVEWEHFAGVGSGAEGSDASESDGAGSVTTKSDATGSIAAPSELAALPEPRVIYVGSVAEWFDFELLFALARLLPSFSFPVVGPLRPALRGTAAAAPPNVHFLGPKAYAELPAWLAHSQAAIIPFLRNELTEAVDPVKIHEYLAAGLPVLSTPFSSEIERLAGPVTLAADARSGAEGLARLIADPPTAEEQRKAARPRSWDLLLDEFARALDEL